MLNRYKLLFSFMEIIMEINFGLVSFNPSFNYREYTRGPLYKIFFQWQKQWYSLFIEQAQDSQEMGYLGHYSEIDIIYKVCVHLA